MGFLDKIGKFAKQVTGIQAIEDKRDAKRLIEEADGIKEMVEGRTQVLTNELNVSIKDYQYIQQRVIKNTIGVFREFLKDLPFKRDDKEYPQIAQLNMEMVSFKMPDIQFSTKERLKTIGVGIAFGVFAAGYVASKYRAEKLTEATQYYEQVLRYKAECERQWVLIEGIRQRAKEQGSVLNSIGLRAEEQLDYLRPLIYEFMLDDEYYILAMEKTRVFLTPITTICSTPLLDNLGQLNGQWNQLKTETKLLLERNL